MDAESFKAKNESCADCHKDPHRGELKAACSSCHTVNGWRGKDLKFEHDKDTKFRLEGKHEPVKCLKCHKATTKEGLMDVASFKTKNESCADCHKDPHRGELKTKCSACHSAHAWRGKDLTFDHGRDANYRLEGKHQPIKCIKCHKETTKEGLMDVASFKIGKYEQCVPCHKHKHKGTFVVACVKCHDFASWKRKLAS